MQLWLYLHFPQLQLDRLYASQEQPLVIVNSQSHQVMQCNPLAVQQGIKHGMGLGSAAALCTDLQVHPYDPSVEEQALNDIAQWLYLVTSDIVLYPSHGLLLKVTDMLALYQGLDNYWQTVSRHLDQQGVCYQFATGFSPYAAILLAKSGQNHIEADKEALLALLRRHPLTTTELSMAQVSKLSRIGIHTLDELLALPTQELARRFDIDLVNYVGRLLGQFKHPQPFYHPPEAFHHSLELLFDIENVQWLEKPLYTQLRKLELFLTLRNQVAFELSLTLHQRNKPDTTLTLTSASGDYLADKWAQLCKLSMESLSLTAPVQGLSLAIQRSAPQQAATQDIFCGEKGQLNELELLSLLQAKLGKEQVHKVAFCDDPRPEKASRLCDPTRQVPERASHPRLRPSLLLPEPEPLNEKVTLHEGPERIVSGWWDGEEVIRDYFIARSHDGRWLWVFRTPQQQWFLHGQFS